MKRNAVMASLLALMVAIALPSVAGAQVQWTDKEGKTSVPSEPLKFKVYPQEDRIAQKLFNGRFAYNIGAWKVSVSANNLFNHNHTQRERILMPIRHYIMTVTATRISRWRSIRRRRASRRIP